MRRSLAILVALAGALPGRAADGPSPVPASAPAVLVGDTYPQVLAKRGHPPSEIDAGSVQMLYYPGLSLKLRDGVVVELKATAVVSPAPAGVPAGTSASPPPPFVLKEDPVEREIRDFRTTVEGRFEAERFADLEVLSAHIIGGKSRFADGSWKIFQFHDALEVDAEAPEERWRAREVGIEKWERQIPDSVTARTAHLGFLASYAWHARGAGSADSSMGVGVPLFNNRLAQAADLYQLAQGLRAKSPMLWFEGARVALGQGWPAKDVLAAFDEAKRAEPEFWHDDGQVARFLLPRWHGKEGDWERFGESEIQREGGLGTEGYARTVYAISAYYKNVFKESQADWALVKEGYGLMFQKYPDSRMLLNEYALLAVLAADRPAAIAAFRAMQGQADPSVWRLRSLSEFQAWAAQAP